MARRIFLRKGGRTWHYERRIPEDVTHLDKRKRVRISLKTSDELLALTRAAKLDAENEKYWNSLRLGASSEEISERYARAVATCRASGFSYLPVDDLATADMAEIVARMRAVKEPSVDESAILGLEEKPGLRASEATE